MIVTVTPNPALDVTYAVPRLTPGGSHHVAEVVERAGGKGVNTAAVLTAMGIPCVAVAPTGGPAGVQFAADLAARGIPARLVDSPCATRRSIAVTEPTGRATLLNEAGPKQPDEVWREVSAAVARLAPAASVLTISGSVPPGTDLDLVARLSHDAQAVGLHVLLDVSGEALLRALRSGPAIAKPNRSEAAVTMAGARRSDRRPGHGGLPSPRDLASALVEAGARVAAVSDGAEGVTLVADGVQLHGWLSRPLRGNTTGAGDALAASFAASLDGSPDLPHGPDAWAGVLRQAVAWSAAAVLQPVAGVINPDDVARLDSSVEVEEIRP